MDLRHNLGRAVHGLARQPRGDHRAALDPGSPARLAGRAAVDGERLHPHLRRPAAHRGHAGRAVRSPAPVHDRPRPVHRRVGGRGHGARHRRPGGRPGRAGRRRRHRHPADPHAAVGRGIPAAPRPGPGRLGRRRRPGHRHRSAGRRGGRGRLLLAVDLLAERADRHRAAADRPAPPHREPRALDPPGPAGPGPGQRRPARHRARRRPRQRPRLDQRHRPAAAGDRRAARGRVHRLGTAGARADAAAAPVPQPRLRRDQRWPRC